MTVELTGGPLDGSEIEIKESHEEIRAVAPLGLRPDPWLNGALVNTYTFVRYRHTFDPWKYEYAGVAS